MPEEIPGSPHYNYNWGQTFNLKKYYRSKHLHILTIRQAATVDRVESTKKETCHHHSQQRHTMY